MRKIMLRQRDVINTSVWQVQLIVKIICISVLAASSSSYMLTKKKSE